MKVSMKNVLILAQNLILVLVYGGGASAPTRSRGGSGRGRSPDDKSGSIRHCQAAARSELDAMQTHRKLCNIVWWCRPSECSLAPCDRCPQPHSPAVPGLRGKRRGKLYRKLHKLGTDKYKCPLCTFAGWSRAEQKQRLMVRQPEGAIVVELTRNPRNIHYPFTNQ